MTICFCSSYDILWIEINLEADRKLWKYRISVPNNFESRLLFTKGYLELYSMSDEIDVMSGWRKTWGMGEVKQSLFLPTYTAFGPISKPIQ